MSASDKTEFKKQYQVITGEDMNEAMLHEIMDIDEEVYGSINPDFVGDIDHMQERFRANKRSFVCLVNNGVIIGYVNFFPVCDALLDQLTGPVGLPYARKKTGKDKYEDDTDAGFDPERYFQEIVSDKEDEAEAEEERKELIKAHFKKYQGVREDVDPENFDEIIKFYNTCRDDDISADEIHPEYYPEKGKNNLFIISVAIKPSFRSKETSIQLTEAFIAYLNRLGDEGTPVNSISAMCVSEGGEKFLRGLNFYYLREIRPEDPAPMDYSGEDSLFGDITSVDPVGSVRDGKKYHERVYICWGYYLDRLLENRLYHKTHKDDIYLFVPFAENPENYKIDNLIDNYKKKHKNESDNDDNNNHFYYEGIIPGEEDYPDERRKTISLLEQLQYYMEYEYEGFIKDELERIYLGECLFRHTTDRYIEDDADEGETALGETVGEEKADLLLLAYRSANMYVMVIYFPECKFSSSMVGDQLSKMKLEYRESMDEFGYCHYGDLIELMGDRYNLVGCGSGKAYYCMNHLPTNGRQGGDSEDTECNQELMNILTGETYFSVHQDFYIKKYKKLEKQLTKDLAIYDYYQAYMSPVSLVMVLDTFEDEVDGKMVVNEEQKTEDAATYVFIVELVLLQNTALTKLSLKVGKALEHEGDVPYEYISQLYRDYGRTLKLWDSDNFKYYGTQMEAEQIRKAFGNDELKERYEKEQEFLENIVDVNAANDERRNGWILGIVGTLLAVFQVDGYIKDILSAIYFTIAKFTGHAESIFELPKNYDDEMLREAVIPAAGRMFNVLVWGGVILFILAWYINSKRKKYEQRLELHSEKDSENWEG